MLVLYHTHIEFPLFTPFDNLNHKNFQIPVYFHNLKGFDGHLIIQGLTKMNFSNIQIIAQNFEKYMTFSFAF